VDYRGILDLQKVWNSLDQMKTYKFTFKATVDLHQAQEIQALLKVMTGPEILVALRWATNTKDVPDFFRDMLK